MVKVHLLIVCVILPESFGEGIADDFQLRYLEWAKIATIKCL